MPNIHIIKKGMSFSIPIVLMNRSKALWGDHALVFRYGCESECYVMY